MSNSEDIYCSVCGTQKGYEKNAKNSKLFDNEDWVCSLKCWKEYALSYFYYPTKGK